MSRARPAFPRPAGPFERNSMTGTARRGARTSVVLGTALLSLLAACGGGESAGAGAGSEGGGTTPITMGSMLDETGPLNI